MLAVNNCASLDLNADSQDFENRFLKFFNSYEYI